MNRIGWREHSRVWPLLVLLALPGFHLDPGVTQEIRDQDIPVIRNESGPVCNGPVFELIPHMVLGKDEGKPEWQIFPRGVGVWAGGPEDRIYIGTSDYIFYIVSNSGRLMGRFSGYGEGPGEHKGGSLLWMEDEEEIWLNDRTLFRLTRFSPDGELLGIISYHDKAEQWSYFEHLRGRRFLGYRVKYINGKPHSSYGLLDENLDWEREVLLVAHPDPEGRTWSPRPGSHAGIPFYSVDWVVPFPDGRFVFGEADLGRLTYYSIDGVPLLRVQDCFEFPRITKDDRERWFRRLRPEDIPAARKAKIPDRWGAFWWPYTDDSGRIWLPQKKYLYNENDEVIGYKYIIVDREGTLLGTQVFEFESNRIEIRGDFLYWADPGGETSPRVRIYRLKPLY